MKHARVELLTLTKQRAEEAYQMASIAVEKKFWNSAASDLYYTCFYLVQALFIKNEIDVSTHKGVKALFAQEFIKSGKLEEKWGKLISKLFDYRQQGDYSNFTLLTEDKISPLVGEVAAFREIVFPLLESNGPNN